MARFLSGVLFSLSAFFAIPAWAQGLGVHAGAKASVVATTLDGQINSKSFYNTGFSGGLMVRFRPSRAFAVQPELLFAQQGVGNGLSPNSTSPDYKINFNYLNVPLMLKVYIGSMFNIQLGPQVGFLLSARKVGKIGTSIGGTGLYTDANVEPDYSGLDFGLNGGLGIDLPIGLVASARINYGLSNISNNADDANFRQRYGLGGLHNRGFEFSLGYLIGAGKDY